MREPADVPVDGGPVAGTLYARIGGHEGIARLLHHFYADVRQHHLLGPVFNSRIRNWHAHLAKIGAVIEGRSALNVQPANRPMRK